ncbi:NADP(H)-dependent aldo-keto reductase [Pasteurellaceae bacterium USgator11]|nr:NADP(H)-dependent aldo-keto reductase [Pasteurellaceae bacterium UScroc12]TNG96012.1 NADP(H)-dependent aldo-keto reductase [Pasteurellaceae bacterium USgator41]TNG98596.1 NADP(H)-dependent aldo-keto reductase [Pasteurellaceae bacterium UScroc31]TNG99989.1 NADP(H)-dependent aldo-keto reductase [Pasteurellaceae bacterium USgator11]
MQYRQLGNSKLQVSAICLGTMTFGEQNSEADAHQQLDYAVSQGINFIDTAEMYPVPANYSTYGKTEQFIGSWLVKQPRQNLILASKIAGPSRGNDNQHYIRGGSRFNKQQIFAACDASLQRLQTDYLDLYQLHWPERQVNYFGQLGLSALDEAADITPLQESLEALQTLQQQGKIRYFGLSNETPWGVMECLRLHKMHALPQVMSVQNPYNLLNRSYEVGLSEISLREQVGLLAYSPLAFGMLSGKYRRQPWPPSARLTLFERFKRYNKAKAFEAVERYAAIAEQAGISLTALSLAFVNQQRFVASNIIGATSLEQLAENIASINVRLSEATLAQINAVHAEISNPCP